MNTEQIKPARFRVVSPELVKRVTGYEGYSQPQFAKWEAPAKFLRQSPPEHRNVPFADDKDYIKADKFDRAVAWALGLGVVVIICVTAWERYVK